MKYLVVGLGNPGLEYSRTRHNVGFIVLDRIADDKIKDFVWEKDNTCSSFVIHDGNGIYIKPITMMNLSGNAVAQALKKYYIEPRNVIVVHDDLDIVFGKWKISKNSGDGGHNGIKSIIHSIGTKDFIRIRVGTAPKSIFGNKKRPNDNARFVLQNFPDSKISDLYSVASDIYFAIRDINESGVEYAMNKYN